MVTKNITPDRVAEGVTRLSPVQVDELLHRLQAKLASRDLQAEVASRFGYGFEHATIGMMVTTVLSQVVEVNETLCKMLGVAREQVLSGEVEMSKLVHPEDYKIVIRWAESVILDANDHFSAEIRYLHADGHWVTFALTSNVVRDEEEDPLYFFTQAIDITPLKQAQTDLVEYAHQLEDANERLEAASQIKTQFLATTSHDLRNPLTTIAGFSQMLLSNPQLDEDKRCEYLSIVVAQAQRVERMINDLLLVSRMDSQSLKLYPEPVLLARQVEKLCASLEIEASIKIDPDLRVYVDPHHLDRMLANYLTNAVKYGLAPVLVDAEAHNEMARIRVCDHGDPIDPEYVPHLFDAFSQAASSAEDSAKGTGLGLAIVHGLANESDGKAWFERRGKCNCFGLTLPQPR